jgi:hypothetical protein
MGDADVSTVIASLGSEEKTQWHRRPCRWKRLRRSAADTGVSAHKRSDKPSPSPSPARKRERGPRQREGEGISSIDGFLQCSWLISRGQSVLPHPPTADAAAPSPAFARARVISAYPSADGQRRRCHCTFSSRAGRPPADAQRAMTEINLGTALTVHSS